MARQKEKIRERIYWTFPEPLVREPLISLLAKKFAIMFNIRGSTVTADMGLVALEFDGERGEVDKTIRPRHRVRPRQRMDTC